MYNIFDKALIKLYQKSGGRKALLKKIIKEGGSKTLSTPSRLKSKIRGTAYDIKRGHLLHKQGYGGRKFATEIAKEGKDKGSRK